MRGGRSCSKQFSLLPPHKKQSGQKRESQLSYCISSYSCAGRIIQKSQFSYNRYKSFEMQCEGERVPNLLERLELGRFQLKELKHFDEFEHKSLGYSTKSLGKTLEITYNVTFNFDVLITHLEIELNSRDGFTQLFEIGQIEASCLTNRGIFSPVIRNNSAKNPNESKNLIVPTLTITQTLKVSLLLKKEFASVYELNFKKERSKTATEENAAKIIAHTIKAVSICGYYLNMNTSASELVSLLNISQSFKQSKRLDEAAEVDILVSLSLISARRFVQASELLKKVSRFYVEKYITSKSSMEFSKIDRSWIKQEARDSSQVSGITRSFAAGRVLDGGKYLYKAAKIELLLAETINQPSLLSEKLEAYHRANSYANGNITPTKIQARVDYEETIYMIGANIIPFLVKMLSDKSEILKISSLKSIQFFYQNLGCTLSGVLPLILKNLIAIYPLQLQRELSQYKTEDNQGERNQLSNRTKLILDHINHLLQSLLGLLTGMNKKYLKIIFEEIIISSISEQYRNQLRLYLLRFGQRILQICGPDLQIPIKYINHVFVISEGKYNFKSELSNKHINHNLTYFAQRIIEILKFKILKNYCKPAPLKQICNWMHETLIYLCENEAIPVSAQLAHILDMIISIYGHTKYSLVYPVEPIIYLLNTSLHQAKMPFDKILEAFIILIEYGDLSGSSYGLGCEIIERIMTRSKISTLSLKQLKILEKVLEVQEQAHVKWLEQFLDCIPHSNFDQIYSVFDLLVMKCVKFLDKRIVSLIINTLFNQYTVKGKAHQHSKEQLIINLIQEPNISFNLFLELCLFENEEAHPSNYYSKNTTKGEHCFDTKLFKLHSELFLEKINLLLLIFNKNELILDKFNSIFTQKTLVKIHFCLRELLLKSSSFKVKSKILVLIKQLILVVTSLDIGKKNKEKILFFKIVMDSLKGFISLYNQSKLHYYTVLNIGLAVKMAQNISRHQESGTIPFDFMSQEVSEHFEVPEHIEDYTHQLCIAQILDMWSNLTNLFNSPWENVREILMLVILNCFKNGFYQLNSRLKQRAAECVRILLLSFLQSNDFTERLTGIKLFAVILGLAKEFEEGEQLLHYIKSNWKYLKQFAELAIALEHDWNEEISSCSKLVTKVCLSKEMREICSKKLGFQKKGMSNLLDNSIYSLNFEEELNFSEKKNSSFTHTENFENILRTDDDLKQEEQFDMPQLSQEVRQQINGFCKSMEKIGYFKIDNMPERDSFAEDEQYFDPNDEKHSEKEKSHSEDEQLEFQDLGIIELDDEEWGQEQSEMKITQKLPLKKVYKLSPNLGASNKHHRIRNKRYHNSEFEQDKIIVDELEGRINYPQISSHQKIETIRQQPLDFKVENVHYLQNQAIKNQQFSQSALLTEPRPSAKKDKKASKKRKCSVK